LSFTAKSQLDEKWYGCLSLTQRFLRTMFGLNFI